MSGASRRKRAGRTIWLVACAIFLVLGFALAARAWHLRSHARSAEIGLSQLDSTLSGGMESLGRLLQDPDQLTALRSTIVALQCDLLEMQSLFRPFLGLSRVLGWVPGIGGDLQAAPALLDLAEQTTAMVLSLFDGLSPLAHLMGQQEDSSLRDLAPEATKQLLLAKPQLQAAHASYEKAVQARKEMDAAKLSPKLQAILGRFDGYAPTAAQGLLALELVPDFLGAQEPKTYLVLAQNSDELRATGGFISGVGTIVIEQGQITSISFQDSYAIDNLAVPHPAAPDPLRQYMKAGMLVLRDANWWPDFPTSARTVSSLYTLDTGRSVDGVVGVDATALELLMEALGPIEVDGYAEIITAENLQAMLTKYWQSPLVVAPGSRSEWWSHRKDLAGDLLEALLREVVDGSGPKEMLAITKVMETALRQRHVQIYLDNADSAARLRRLRWDGAIQDPADDFFLVVDSNVGFNKVNPNIEQSINYDVALGNSGTATSQLTLTYRHKVERPTPACVHEPRYGDSYEDLMERCYWDYLRVYLPAGSELIELAGSDAPPTIYEDSGCTVVGTEFLLETGQSRTLRLTYRHTTTAEKGEYTLLVQKQAGAQASLLRVRVQPPGRAANVGTRPNPTAIVDGDLVWQGILDQDAEFAVTWDRSDQ